MPHARPLQTRTQTGPITIHCAAKLIVQHCNNQQYTNSLSVLTAIFPGEPGLSSFIGAKDDEGGGDN